MATLMDVVFPLFAMQELKVRWLDVWGCISSINDEWKLWGKNSLSFNVYYYHISKDAISIIVLVYVYPCDLQRVNVPANQSTGGRRR